MTWYERYILPRLIDWGMKNAVATECRKRVIPRATGRVLEVGVGSGLNLPFYGRNVTRVWGIDPSPAMLAMARPKAARVAFPVELLCASAEEIPLEDRSVDSIVLTWTMCTIPDPRRALLEMKRVLKAGGEVLFVEHGRSPDPSVQAWQERLNPVWKRLAGGCHLNRKIDDLLRGAGFTVRTLETSYLPGPRPLTYTFEGVAVRPGAGED